MISVFVVGSESPSQVLKCWRRGLYVLSVFKYWVFSQWLFRIIWGQLREVVTVVTVNLLLVSFIMSKLNTQPDLFLFLLSYTTDNMISARSQSQRH